LSLDVLLVELWSSERRYKLISDNIGIAYLKASLDSHTGLTTGMLNSHRLYFGAAQARDPLETILEYASSYCTQNPQLILGISATQCRLPELKQLITMVRAKHPSIVVIAGGYGPTFAPADVLSFGASAVCIGEGDETVVELVQALRGKMDLAQVAGIAYMEGDRLAMTSPRRLVDVRSLPLPSLDYLNGRSMGTADYTYANRGCPHRCDFCFIHRFYKKGVGKVWRSRTAEQLYQELRLRKLRNPNLEVLLFGDDNFLVEADFLIELRRLIKGDPTTQDLMIEFGLGAYELNRHWPTIERCIDIITKIELGYESRVPGFLARQRKGPPHVDIVEKNRQAIVRLQKARSKYTRFDYEVFHILGDRHSTVQELGEIYPHGKDNFDNLEWATKILKSGSNVVMYFDGRDRTYPLYVRAYSLYIGALSRYANFLPWVTDNVTGYHRDILEKMIESAFSRAYKAAIIVYDRHGEQRGHYLDIDDELRRTLEGEIKVQEQELHRVLSVYLVDLAYSLLVDTPLSELLSKPWFEGYSSRLLRRFESPDLIPAPSYVRLFAAIFAKYEELSEQLASWVAEQSNWGNDEIVQLYGELLVDILKSLVSKDLAQGFPEEQGFFVEQAILDATLLLDEMAEQILGEIKQPV
jgi:hypothetical protein